MSGFDDRNIVGLVQSTVEERREGSWAMELALYNGDSSSEIEKYGLFGGYQKMREWIGARQAAEVAQRNFEIRNRKYESTLSVPNDLRNRDKSGLLSAHIENWVDGTIAYQWEDLATDLINRANTATCFDGKTFYATDHQFADEAAQSNSLSASDVPALNVADPTAPTGIEMARVVVGLVSYMLTYKDDKGRYVNSNGRAFTIDVATLPLFMALNEALDLDSMAVAGGGNADNPIRGLVKGGFKLKPLFTPELTNATQKVRVFRTDARVKGIILQEERAIEFKQLGAGSDYEFENDAHKWGVQCNRGAGFGDWKASLEGTLS